MQWFFIALGAPFLWALVNISDQYLVEKYSTGKRGSGGLVLFMTLFATKFFPGIAKENMSRSVLLPKIIAIFITILGSAILFI